MEAFGNQNGFYVTNNVSGTRTVIGNENLSLGRGNKVHDNSQSGIFANAQNSTAIVVGNTVNSHRASLFGTGIQAGNGVEIARNAIYDNWTGISTSGSSPIRENRVYGNVGTGINANNNPLTSNVIYNNSVGIVATASQALFSHNLIYANTTTGVKISQGGPDLVNNTIYQSAGNAVRMEGGAANVILRNNIVWATGGTGVSISNDSQTGFVSDYNLLYATGTGIVGSWLGANQGTLQQWQNATSRDVNSLANDPLFVDIDGADNVLGYVANVSHGNDDDFHLQSPFGSLHGGSLAPVLSATSGLPVFPLGALTNDASLSSAMDRGAPTDSFANEPTPNGGFINIGHDGNTPQASLSPAQLLLMFDPNGGEVIAQGSTFPIRWRANGFAGNVLLAVSSAGAAGPFQVLANNEPNDGVYNWLVDAGSFPASTNYFLRISSIDQPAVADVSDAAFEVAAPTNTYYVNIAGDVDFTDNEYTTAAGSTSNTGLGPTSPLASIQAVLNTYDLEPGDVIYVDTGSYAVTTNIVIGAGDSGVRIQGPVSSGHRASLNRGSTASGSYVFSLSDATDVTLDALEIFGGNEGVFVNLASHDLTITNSIVRNNAAYGIHVTSTANRAEIADSQIYSNNSGGIFVEGDDAIVRNNIIRNNSFSVSRGIEVASTAANTLIRQNDIFSNVIGILTTQPATPSSGLRIEGNSVHGNNNTGILVNGAGLVLNNDAFSNTGGNPVAGISISGGFVEARDNTSHGNQRGINVSGGAVARNNRVYGNSVYGIQMSQAAAYNNFIYSNAIGIYAGASGNQIANNLIYANTTVGIDHNFQTSSRITNNTIYQVTGDAIRATTYFAPATAVSATNNIIVVAAGSAFNVVAQNQAVFSSDYNLFQLSGTGKIATFGTTFSNWSDWQFATGNDRHGLQTDPLFVDPDGGDNTLGTLDDDFHLSAGSPAEDAGHPLTFYGGESASGSLPDLGAYGNTLEASVSATQSIQLVEPITYQKLEAGQPVQIKWISSGLTNPAPVALMNVGGVGVYDATSGRWSPDTFRGGFGGQSASFTQSVDVSGVTNPPPVSVLQSYTQNQGSTEVRYDIPLADGDYQVRLFFVDPTSSAANQRRFDVGLQGQTVLSNYDIFADVGVVRKSVAKSFSITASGGSGLNLSLKNRLSFGIINAIEVTNVNAAAPTSFIVNLEFSPNNGQSWSTIATNLPSNRFGDGQFTWTSDQTTQGHTGIFRATAVGSGLTNVSNTSTRGVSVCAATDSYYVNTASDVDFTDNEYTTAAGNDLNSGATPESPLASLAVLLRDYTLNPGDTIYVDSGTYNLSDNIDLSASHSGITIQGPQVGSHAAVFSRGNTTAGNYVFNLRDAANVTLDSLELAGAAEAVRVDLASHNFTLSNSVVRNNGIGVDILSTASGTALTSNEFISNSGNTIEVAGDNSLIEGNTLRNNSLTAVNLTSTAQNATVRGNEFYANSSYAVFSTSSSSGVIEQNIVRSNLGTSASQAMIVVANASTPVQDNVIFGNNKPAINLATASAIAQRNTVYDNLDGFIGTGVIRDNRIFHNMQAGVRITSSNPAIERNTIYANATGIVTAPGAGQSALFANNVIYDQTAFGIDIGTGLTGLRVLNNTIFEPTGTAIRLNATGNADVRNNILSTDSGTLLNVANHAQAGFTSDYNLMQVSGAGRVGTWGADPLNDLTQWYFEVGRDGHSLSANPQFIDIDGPDGRRGYDVATSTDYGADDDFHVAFGSPAVNAGDPVSYYAAEPSNGNRVNLGAYGNLADATTSPAQTIQLTEPGIFRKFELGQPISLNWVSSGFTANAPVALLNSGGSSIYDTALGRWSADAYRTGGTNRTVTGTIDMSGVTNPPPVAVLQSYADVFANGVNGASLRYSIPLADGAYDVRLFFVEPSGGNVRRFDVRLQGQTVLDNYNIQADAGAVRKAVAKSFSVSAAAGQGLSVQLVNDGSAAGFDAVISGIEVTRANPGAPAAFAANVDFSPNNGQTWSTIATNLLANRFGEGSLTWNATTETSGSTGRFRITAVSNGVPTLEHVSQPFSIANNGAAYYVNVSADVDLSNNEFTTASGDNLNSGKSPNVPMRSLAALLRAYDLDAGDTIYVDSGTYGRLLTNATFVAEDSGVTLQGPTQLGHAAVLTRGTSAVGSAVLEFAGGVTDVLVDSLELHTAENGVSIVSGSNIEIRNSLIRNNSSRGIDVNSTAANVHIANNQIEENVSRGIETRGSQVTIENNLIRNSDRGIHVNGTPSGNVVIRSNDIFGHNVGVEASANVIGNVIQGNKIHDNATHGIFATGGSAGGLQIIGNDVYGQSGTNDVGIFYSVSGGFAMTVRDNLIHHNYFGFDIPAVTGTVQRNQIYANSNAGIRLSGTSNLIENQIYTNATGVLLTGSSTTSTVRNNLIYNNTNFGIDVSNGNYLITHNTIVHPVGTAVRFTGNGTGRFKNNIVQADVGTLVSVATGGQAAFVSDYNLLYPTSAAANVGVWGSTTAATLGNWQATSGRDANSVSADPLFLDIDGADNVLGEQGVPEGNGFDDNFGLQANSPAIDAGDGSVGVSVDALGRPRHDDPDVVNTGTGSPDFVDFGAFEFQGNSADVTPPTVASIQPSDIQSSGTVFAPVSSITATFSEPIDLVSARSSDLYELRGDGLDGQFDTADDLVVGISSIDAISGSPDVTLNLSQSLPTDRYRLTLVSRPGQALIDQAGNRLDGDANGSAGGDYVRSFQLITGLDSISDANPAADQVTENALAATPVGITALSIDPDAGDNVSYSLNDTAGGRFMIHPSTGVVSVATGGPGIDREQNASHDIVVRATSTDGTFVTRMFTIAVLDVDEFDVGPVTDANNSANEVSENVPNGTLVGITALAIDADATNSVISYALTNSAGGRFVIDVATGVVTVAGALDREAAAAYDITVRATSTDNSFSDAVLTISLLDVDEFDVGAIADVNVAANQVSESAANGTAVGITAFAVDNDATNSAITYTLDDNAGGRFAIHPATGVITKAGPLSVAMSSSHNVTIRATSADGSSSTNVSSISVLPGGSSGDFDGDGDLDLADVDALSTAIATGSGNLLYDVTGDGQLTLADLQHWVLVLKHTLMGDSNLDFVVDGQDFIRWNTSKFTNSTLWSQGNFNADTVVDGQDFIVWNVNKFTSVMGTAGDFDGDQDLDGNDVDALSAAAAAGTNNPLFDVTGDGLVNVQDVNYWVTQLKGTILADANLDSVVDGVDYIAWNIHKFMPDTHWTHGNFNADTVVDGQDFIVWNIHKFTTAMGSDPGDFDGDDDLDGDDIDALTSVAAAGTNLAAFDVTGDGLVNAADVNYWVTQLKHSILGDANLDFVVDGADYITWNTHKFTLDTRWTHGNFNADTAVDGADYIVWNGRKFTSAVSLRPRDQDEKSWIANLDEVFAGEDSI